MMQTVFLNRSMFIGIPPPFACSCPTRRYTWAWCCCSLRKILTWEKTERNKEVIITTNPDLRSWQSLEKTMSISNHLRSKLAGSRHQGNQLKVTVCLYLNPSNSARSLSTLIAVAVVRKNPQKVKLKIPKVKCRIRQFPLAIPIKKAAKSGLTMTPAQKSVKARQRIKNFVGGWIDDTLWRAMRIRVLPSVAVKARKMFNEKVNTNNGLW